MAIRRILSGADIVLPDRMISAGSVVIEAGRVVDVAAKPVAAGGEGWMDAAGCVVVPGFIDVHVHGVAGLDCQDGPGAVAAIAARMPQHGVTAFSPTTVACAPDELRMVIEAVRACRERPEMGSARVLPAHLESNFVNPDYKGAQPAVCLRSPAAALAGTAAAAGEAFAAAEILRVIDAAGPDVGIVTLAPELDRAMALIERLVASGRIVSLGHSAATFDVGVEAIRIGARHATHLFNRMPPVGHREPGLAGAVLQSADVAAEIVCDGFHVHPGMVRTAIAAKGADRVMAITDGSAGAGLPVGTVTRLGGRDIHVRDQGAFLADHTLAGSTATMDKVFRVLTGIVGLSVVEAAQLCSTTPARELGLTGHGVIAAGAVADLVVLDAQFRVRQTLIAGEPCIPV